MSADLHRWPADVHDTCGNVFGLALRTARPAIKADARTLEIGCAEFDWLSKAGNVWPAMQITGIDWRKSKPSKVEPPNVTRLQGDVMTAHFEPASFDWIVGISSLEHVGLGHYAKDPPNPDGDTIALANAYRWLAPGGWLYFDVPWNTGDSYQVHGTSHRIYDDATIQSRLLQGFDWSVQWRGLVHARKTGTLVTQPDRLRGGEEFFYLMLWVQKGRHAATP